MKAIQLKKTVRLTKLFTKGCFGATQGGGGSLKIYFWQDPVSFHRIGKQGNSVHPHKSSRYSINRWIYISTVTKPYVSPTMTTATLAQSRIGLPTTPEQNLIIKNRNGNIWSFSDNFYTLTAKFAKSTVI